MNDHSVKKIPTAELMRAVSDVLQQGYQAQITVTGGSMRPFLHNGRDRVILEKRPASALKKGDIVLIEPVTDKFLLHRITRINQEGIQTTGDGNCFRDGVFSPDCTVGVVTAVIRKNKTISVRNPLYRLTASLWQMLFPVRRKIIRLYRAIHAKH